MHPTAKQVTEKLNRIEHRVNPGKYATAKNIISTYASNCEGNTDLNALAKHRLTVINLMSEEDMIYAIEGLEMRPQV